MRPPPYTQDRLRYYTRGASTPYLRRLGIATAFDHIINSSVVGAAKPDPAIFAAAGAPVARRLGLTGHDTGAAKLRDRLQALGLLAPA
jgi:hypothetical protein